MPQDPVCGMTVGENAIKLIIDGKEYFFCSARCRDKFSKQQTAEATAVCCPSSNTFFQNKLFVISCIVFIALVISWIFPLFLPFRRIFLTYEIYRQTGALGNSFVFLMAGVATDYTEIGLLWSNVGRRVALWLPIVSVPQVILIGYLVNLFIK